MEKEKRFSSVHSHCLNPNQLILFLTHLLACLFKPHRTPLFLKHLPGAPTVCQTPDITVINLSHAALPSCLTMGPGRRAPRPVLLPVPLQPMVPAFKTPTGSWLLKKPNTYANLQITAYSFSSETRIPVLNPRKDLVGAPELDVCAWRETQAELLPQWTSYLTQGWALWEDISREAILLHEGLRGNPLNISHSLACSDHRSCLMATGAV